MNKLPHLALLLAAVVLAGADKKQAGKEKVNRFRTWTDSSGKFKVKAKLLAVKNGKVTLQKKNGKRVSLPLGRLSKADRQHLKSIPKTVAKPKADQELIQGKWRMSRVSTNGRVVGQVDALITGSHRVYTFTGNEVIITSKGKGSEKGTFKLDPSKNPKQIILVDGRVGEKSTTTGIYKIEKNTLTMSVAKPGKPVPTDFTSKKGDDRTLTVLKRVGSKKKSRPKKK